MSLAQGVATCTAGACHCVLALLWPSPENSYPCLLLPGRQWVFMFLPRDFKLDADGVPVLSADDVECIATEVLRGHNAHLLRVPCSVSISRLVGEYSAGDHLSVVFESLSDSPTGPLAGAYRFVPPTIVLAEELASDRPRLRAALAHEFAHFLLHRNLRVRWDAYTIRDNEEHIHGDADRPAHRWMEWQARRLGAALLIPSHTLAEAIKDEHQLNRRELQAAAARNKYVETVTRLIAIRYRVSVALARLRMHELGVAPRVRRSA